MRVSNISFKGGYIEQGPKRILLDDARNELSNARPYLRLIASSLPYENDLFVKIQNDGADDVFTVSLKDNKKSTTSDLLKRTEHQLIGSGFGLVGDTFKELEKHNKEIFEKTAMAFRRNFSRLESDLDPKYNEFIKGVAEVAVHPSDHCC